MKQRMADDELLVCFLLLRLRPSRHQEVPDDYSVSRLLECIKVAHGRELEEAKNARRMLNEAQLRSLSLDQLLEMQENISLIIKVGTGGEAVVTPWVLRVASLPWSLVV